jgi:hypothetical protein
VKVIHRVRPLGDLVHESTNVQQALVKLIGGKKKREKKTKKQIKSKEKPYSLSNKN